MGVETGISNGADDGYVLFVGDEEAGFGVFVAATESKVNHEQLAGLVLDSHHEVLGLYVPVDIAFGMQELHLLQDLDRQKQRSLQAELTPAHGQEVLQVGSQQLKDHEVVTAFRTRFEYLREPRDHIRVLGQGVQNLYLIWELAALGGVVLNLYCHLSRKSRSILLFVNGQYPDVHLAEGPFSDVMGKQVFLAADSASGGE